MIGVAPYAAILPVRVMRGPVHLGEDDVARGVRVAAGKPTDDEPHVERADVISMSLGGFGFKDLKSAIKGAIDNGIIVVCAARNNFSVVVDLPSTATHCRLRNHDGEPAIRTGVVARSRGRRVGSRPHGATRSLQ